MERMINLFIGLIVSLLFIYLTSLFGTPHLDIFQVIPFAPSIFGMVTELIVNVLQVIGFILFVKVAYILIKEIWRFK